MGMPWSGPRGPLVLRSLARERASSRTWGLTVMIARSPESVGKIRPGTCSSPRQKNRRVFPQIQDRADEYRCGSKRAPFRKVLTKPTPVRIAARQLSARVNARRNARKRWGRVGIGLWIRKSVRTEAKFPSRGSRLAGDLRRGVRRVVASLASPVDLRSPESVGKIRPGTCSSPRQKNRRVFPQIQDRADEYRCGSKRAPFRKVLTKPTPVRKVNSLASGLFTRLTMRKDRRRSGRPCTATGMSPVRQRVTSGKLGHRQMPPGNLVACKNRWASHPKGNRN